jgi:putative flippase GtrA
VEAVDVHYQPAAVVAFCVAVTNNFLLNRHWTFRAADGRAAFQAPRFLIVSLIALGFNLLVLELLVGVVGVHAIPGQAAAVLAATPFNFVGNKLWSFSRLTHRASEAAPG